MPEGEEEPAAAPETPAEAQGAPDGELYEVTFTVRGTLAQLKTLKEFLIDGGYNYEY